MKDAGPIVKICGLKSQTDVALCASLGADILGFVTEYPEPVPWNLTSAEAAVLLAKAPPSCKTCLVTGGTVHEIIALATALMPDFIQLHYHETPSQTAFIADALRTLGIAVIKAVFPNMSDLDGIVNELCKTGICALLADPRTPSDAARDGITDTAFFERVRSLSTKPVILAGGITPGNVARLLKETNASYIDVMTGVERAPGVKDPSKVEALLRAAKGDTGA